MAVKGKVIELLGLVGVLFLFAIVVPLLFAALIPLSILAMGVVTLGAGGRSVVVGGRSSRWPKAPGKIVLCELSKSDSGAGRNRSVTFKPTVVYRYVVDGREHSGSALGALDSWGSRGWAERMMRRFPVGSDVEVRYSPRNPAEAFLIPGINPWSVVVALAGLGVLAIAALLYARLIPQYPRVIAVRETVCMTAFAVLYLFWKRRHSASPSA